MIEALTNWAGNYQYTAARVHYPRTVEQIIELVRKNRKVKVLGTRHSFNGIADSPGGDLISLKHLDQILEINPAHQTVTIQAGVTYGQLSPQLHHAGFALANLASLPHISVAGACATGTHGSGAGNGNLANSVVAMKIITGASIEQSFSAASHPDIFPGMVIGLGALGVVTQLTLKVIPTYQMRQEVYENLPLEQLKEHFDQIISSAYSVSLFTDWSGPRINQVWIKRRAADATEFVLDPHLHGGTPAKTNLHPIAGVSAENCTKQMGIIGPWHERLPHFRMDFTPSSGEELQTEYLVPREHALPAIEAIDEMRAEIAPLVQISEIRTIAGDQLWMSPCYEQKRGCVAIHFTWVKDWTRVGALLPKIETNLERFAARPHWGKLFVMRKERLTGLYERMGDFRSLIAQFDPERKLTNGFLAACLD